MNGLTDRDKILHTTHIGRPSAILRASRLWYTQSPNWKQAICGQLKGSSWAALATKIIMLSTSSDLGRYDQKLMHEGVCGAS